MARSDAKPVYKIFGVRLSGVVEGRMRGAPPDSRLCAWGQPRGCGFVVRYMPSRKGWIVLDIRSVRARQFGTHGQTGWFGHVRLERVYPNEDAAIMHAMTILGQQPKLL